MPRPRGTGSVYLQKGSAVWWVKCHRNGKPYRESTHTTNEKKAQDFLKQRLGEIVTGNFCGPKTERVRIDELADDFLRDYRINGKKSLEDAEARWKLHIKPFFGDVRAIDVSSGLIARYVDKRNEQKAKNATINRETCRVEAHVSPGSACNAPEGKSYSGVPQTCRGQCQKGLPR